MTRVVPVVMEAQLPAGMAGPEPIAFDVRSFLLAHESGVTLIDTGLERDAEPIARALLDLGSDWVDVTDVIFTHSHPDHVGGLGMVAARAPSARMWGGRDDAHPAPVRPVDDGDTIRGLRVLATPGHTAGHLCLLQEDHGILFAGDAVGSGAGQLTQGPTNFIADKEGALGSLRRLVDLRADRMLFGHGDEVADPAEALAAYVALGETR